MCYFVEHNIQRKELETRFNVKFPEDPRYTPSFFQSVFNKPFMSVVTSENPSEIQLFQWGMIPFWVKDEQSAEKIRFSTANARAETIWDKPSFRKPIQSSRCLVTAHGFFEYQTTKDLKIPYYIKLKDSSIFAFAGIYDKWTNRQTGEITSTFSIITTVANPLMEKIHNLKKRMPVILPEKNEEEWLDTRRSREDIDKFMQPFPEQLMEAYTVSRKIAGKNPDINDPSIIEKENYDQNPELF